MDPLGLSSSSQKGVTYLWQKRGREKKRELLWGKEKKERKEFSLIVLLSQSLSLESRKCPLIGKAWRPKRIEEKIFCCENQETWRAQDWKVILGMFLIFFWFDIYMIHDPLNNNGCENVISCKKKLKVNSFVHTLIMCFFQYYFLAAIM